jgi:D-inositol-3-phosphate glycosyltransferase
MLKIALVAEPRSPRVEALAAALTAAGHDVTVGAAVTCSPRPDVVHANGWAGARKALAAARELDVPFVFSPHTAVEAGDPGLLRDADHVIATYSAQRLRAVAAGVSRENVSVVPYGVDVDHFTPDGGHVERRRPRRVIALGDVTPASGFGTPVAALPALPDAELVLVGARHHGKHAADLRDFARSLGVADRVHLTGPAPRAEMPALLRSADLMVCSPWEAGFGMAALEAMACGIAVVANGLGGLADTVVDKVTGTHVTPRKPRELAATLRRMLSHLATCEQLGAAGRDRATARYSWERVALETVHAYHRAGV